MNNWPTKNIEDLSQQPTPQIKGVPKKEYKSVGSFPIIDQGAQLIVGYSDNEKKVYRSNLPVVVFGDHTRIFKYIDFPFVPGADGTKILIPSVELNPKYFYFALRNCELENLGYSRHFKVLKNKKISIPPLSEQKRIVARIEKLMGKIEEAKKLRQEAIEETDQIIPSALHQIFSRAEKEGWPVKTISEVAFLNPKKETTLLSGDLVSFIPMGAVDAERGEIISPEERKLSEVNKGYTFFQENDLLFAKITPCMENGKTAIARNLKNGTGLGSTEFHVMRPKEGLLIKWLYYILRQPRFRDEAKRYMTGTAGQQRVPKEFLENYQIPLPPLSEQKKIVGYLDSLSEKVKELKKLQLETAADLDALSASILHQAFEGKF